MLIPNDGVNILNTFSVMIIFILLLLLTNLHLKLLITQGIGTDKLLSATQRVNLLITQEVFLCAMVACPGSVLFFATETQNLPIIKFCSEKYSFRSTRIQTHDFLINGQEPCP